MKVIDIKASRDGDGVIVTMTDNSPSGMFGESRSEKVSMIFDDKDLDTIIGQIATERDKSKRIKEILDEK